MVLMTQSQKWHDKYSLPGGHVRKGELLFQALQREIKEETRIEVKSADLVAIGEVIDSEEYFEPERHFIVFVFRVEPVSFRQPKLNEEAYRLQWLPVGEIESYPLTRPSKIAILRMDRPVIDHYE